MKRAGVVLLAGFAFLAGAFFVVQNLNEFSRVQNAEVGNTPIERGTVSRVVVRNNSPKKIAFQLRCGDKGAAGGEKFSRSLALQARASVDVDINPELAGRELPAIVESKLCEAMWRGPFGISCRAWSVRWVHGQRTRKSVSLAEEEGACRIATCYALGSLARMPSCLSSVYLSGVGRQGKP